MKADNDNDIERGYMDMSQNTITIDAGEDGISAKNQITLTDNILFVKAGGGSDGDLSEERSMNGIKSSTMIVINSGTYDINTADDGVHSNDSIVINGGDFSIFSGDDGVHSDSLLLITGGNISIAKSYEGLDSATVVIKDGQIDIGQIAYEILASSLEPYPRKEGAAFEWEEPNDDGDGAEESPFAALKSLKPEEK